jgi:hypothetical protein
MTEKMAVLAPMPKASAAIAIAVKPGLFENTRREWHTSATKFSMLITTIHGGEKVSNNFRLRGGLATAIEMQLSRNESHEPV